MTQSNLWLGTQALLQAMQAEARHWGPTSLGTPRGELVSGARSQQLKNLPELSMGAGGRALIPLGPQGQLTPLQSQAGSPVLVAPCSYPSNRPFLTSQGQDSGVWELENLLAKLSPWGSLPSVVPSMCLE